MAGTNDRILSLDILRGFALLGILIMNIMSFAMLDMAYFSPVAYQGALSNQIIYSVSHVLADQKFMAIFSMMFGASVHLYINSLTKKGLKPARYFFSRNFWLLIIGLGLRPEKHI